jgi:tRNA pseudouridine13 synthase
MPDVDLVREGDIAKKTDTGGLFVVEDPDREQPRAESCEISPTGLVPGGDPWFADGNPGKREQSLLGNNDLTPESFDKVGYLRSGGTRRAFRFSPVDPSWKLKRDEQGPYGQLEFTVTSGSYATVLLREIIRN